MVINYYRFDKVYLLNEVVASLFQGVDGILRVKFFQKLTNTSTNIPLVMETEYELINSIPVFNDNQTINDAHWKTITLPLTVTEVDLSHFYSKEYIDTNLISNKVFNDVINELDNTLKTSVEDSIVKVKSDTNTNINNAYNASIAYIDGLVKSYETISLYIGPNNLMSTTKPTGTGSIIEKTLTTTEQLIYSSIYTIPNDGIILKDNMYLLDLFFNSISTSRVTYIRTKYSVNDIVIFDVVTALNNTIGDHNLYRQVINSLTVDTPYTANSLAKLEIFGKVDNGTDRMEFLIGNENKLSGLYRNAPVATLSTNKIVDNNGVNTKSQAERNREVERIRTGYLNSTQESTLVFDLTLARIDYTTTKNYYARIDYTGVTVPASLRLDVPNGSIPIHNSSFAEISVTTPTYYNKQWFYIQKGSRITITGLPVATFANLLLFEVY